MTKELTAQQKQSLRESHELGIIKHPTPQKPKSRTSSGLRDILFDELEALMADDVDSEHAAGVAKLAVSIIKTAEIELKFMEMKSSAPNLQLEFLKKHD